MKNAQKRNSKLASTPAVKKASSSRPDAKKPTHIVALGASAGGLEALERFFRAMPDKSGMAFVVVQHLSPDFKSLMSELLERFTRMPATPVSDRCEVLPDQIYLLPPGKELHFDGDLLVTKVRAKEGPLFLPINILFRSLASAWGERAVAIVLSGTGSDGSKGILDIQDNGGLVLAESPDMARFTGMPQSAIDTGVVDAILPPEDMPDFLLAYARDPEEAKSLLRQRNHPQVSGGIPKILQLLHERYNIDFNLYKPGTINRRIERRIAFHASASGADIEDYIQRLQNDYTALNTLFKDLLIGVTRFFRDPVAFERLNSLIPQMISNLARHKQKEHEEEVPELRVWVCACSTGEEAYSIAILLLEYLEQSPLPFRVKIIASDLHQESINTAASGIYDEECFSEMAPRLREKYFETIGNGQYRVIPILRKCIIFSRHNLLASPPFTKLDLISCRNLLIYFNTEAQTKALATFHYSLNPDGVLFLGSSESLGELLEDFEVIDRQWKLFHKSNVTHPRLRTLRTHYNDAEYGANGASPKMPAPLNQIYDALLNQFIPSGLLVNDQNQILHIFGEGKRFIEPSVGRFASDLPTMMAKDLQVAVLSAIRSAARKSKPVILKSVPWAQPQGLTCFMTIEVTPVEHNGQKSQYFMVVITDQANVEATIATPPAAHELDLKGEAGHYIRDLETDLQRTRESLQSTVEELETSNEELQAANEELLAANEELQSTNEELHSVNEELYSVNAEHELKIEELNRLSADLRNLIHSTDVATLFVDKNRRIRMFTPKSLEIFSLLPQDIGRDLQGFNPSVRDDLLIEDIDQARLHGIGNSRLINYGDDRSYLRRCNPYHDVMNQPDGAVISYTDTTQITRINRALDESEARFELILQTTPNAILVLDDKSHIVIANHRAEQLFCADTKGLVGTDIHRLIPDRLQRNDLGVKAFLEHLSDFDHTLQHRFKALTLKGLEIDINLAYGQMLHEAKSYRVLVIMDITQLIKSELANQQALDAATSLASTRRNFMANISHEMRTPLNAIMGSSQLGMMADYHKGDIEALSELFVMIHRNSEHLLHVVEDVLDFSQIDNNSLNIHKQWFDLCKLVIHSVKDQAMAMEGTNPVPIRVVKEGFDADVLPFFSDRHRVEQILDNLLSNAVKFTHQGDICVTIRKLTNTVALEIKDTGVGIKAGDLNRIFEPFEQADSSSTRKYGGTGLGLAITRRLVELLDGEIRCSSELDKGSQFIVYFPCETPPEAELADILPTRRITPSLSSEGRKLKGLHVALAEDDPENRFVIEGLLVAEHVTVTSKENGAELVGWLLSRPTHYPDVVLMDLQMPVMDGLEACRKIHEFDPHLPVIALTAHAFPEQRAAAELVGMKGYLTQPVDPEVLYATLRHCETGSNPSPEASDKVATDGPDNA